MPLPSNDNLFVIPSLIPPLISSSATGSKNLGGKENDRKYATNIINNRTKNGNGTTMQSSSLLHHPSKQHSRQDVTSKTGKTLMSSSPNVNSNSNSKQSHHLRRTNPKQTKRKALSPIEIISSSSTKKINKSNNSPFSSSPSFASPAPAIPISSFSSSSTAMLNRSGKKRVLLFGETIESLFCLNKVSNTNDEHYQLCRGIVDGPCTDDPGTWRRVLEMAWNSPNTDAGAASVGSSRKDNLVRLHRRATLRFSLSDQQNLQEVPHISSSSSSRTKRRRNIFEIWLSFAKSHANVGNLEEARRTFRFMENNEKSLLDFSSSTELEEGIGSAAKFYMSYANFESNYFHDNTLAQQILLRGIKRKAEPIQKLEKALIVLRSSSNNDHEEDVTRQFRTNNGIRVVEKHKQSPSLYVKTDASQIIRRDYHRSPRTKAPIMDNCVQKLSQNELSSPSKHQQKNQLIDTGNNNNNNNNINNDNDVDVDDNRIKITTEKSSKIINKAGHHYTNGSPTPMITLNRSTSKGKPPVNNKRPSLTSRLARNRLSGKAKRVDCSINIDDDDDSSSDDETNSDRACTTQDTDDLSLFNKAEASSKPGVSKSDRPSSKVPSFKKVDLSYMWAWDPSAKGKDQNQPTEKSSDATNSTGSGQSTFATHVTASGTQGSGDSSSGELSTTSAAKKTPAQSRTPSRAKEGDRSDVPAITVGVIEKETTDVDRKEVEYDDKKTLQSDPRMSRRQELVAKANLEFLPLVHEDNILRVRDSTYAKLGVIGKGGSCKVYRALSKKCSVVAIKKVKLAGMDAKAIEGYANEISLLKRLRGNPAIIQMYDSEVDLHRKSIFVVMELGEVDLNHVLQQRALNDTSRSLNMNFIRLTWQQMLSAVHCIHEERIIHSDLKPANFLFVRGALKLIDFGIAKAIANDDTTNIYRENHIGTLNYMSPESILDTGSGEDGARMRIGRASDVWSLGCILYEMVYGKTPFAKLHFIQKLQAIVNTGHVIHFPEDEEAEAAIDAMKQCLCRNPEERPPIIGKHGLLNEHWFLHSKRRASL
jgi:serine/threonine-protein kinase TTK/MPS1